MGHLWMLQAYTKLASFNIGQIKLLDGLHVDRTLLSLHMLQSNEITSYIPSKKHKRQCGETGRRDCQALVQQEPCGPRYIRKFKKLNKRVTRGKKIVNTPNYAPLRGAQCRD